MAEPDFIIPRTERTLAGFLTTRKAHLVAAKLARGGFAVLPSDTCYTLAALAMRRDTFRNVNTILNRGDEPMSLAFSSYLEVQRYVHLELLAQSILETFTPGPVTVVCSAHLSDNNTDMNIPEAFFVNVVGSNDRTIGVRIPDSLVERDIASAGGYPITSVAIRDSRGRAIRDFKEAVQIVSEGVIRLGGPGWVAVEGDHFEYDLSTVVAVERGKVRQIRAGAVPFGSIAALQNSIPTGAMDDWT